MINKTIKLFDVIFMINSFAKSDTKVRIVRINTISLKRKL